LVSTAARVDETDETRLKIIIFSEALYNAKNCVGDCPPACQETRYRMTDKVGSSPFLDLVGNSSWMEVRFGSDSLVQYLRNEVYTYEDILGIL
jgi:hypothetical protein